jgi:hypothetical protein
LASILVALANDPSYGMAHGHTDPTFMLRVYSHMARRDAGD